MSTHDEITVLLSGLDQPVAPRVEFAEALRARLLRELRPPISIALGDQVRSSRPGRLTFLGRPRWRVAVVALVLLLLLASAATATYLSGHGWFSPSPRGVQVTSDFRLTKVVKASTDLGWFWSTALSADGHDFYLVPDDGMVYRARGVDTPHPSSVKVYFNPSSLLEPAFCGGVRRGLATAPGGDLFILGYGSRWGCTRQHGLAAAVAVVRPDGSHQVVVTYRQLRDRGLLPATVLTKHGAKPVSDEDASFEIAAPAATRLVLLARVSRHHQVSGGPFDLRYFLIEVVDPNGDGDWSDRVIRPLALPRSVPGFDGVHASEWLYDSPTVERPLPGDAHGALLVSGYLVSNRTTTRSRFASNRLYRLDDHNDDGDLLDARETSVVLEGSVAPGAAAGVASRIDRSSGRPRRQLVVAGLQRRDRISLVSDDGRVTDVGRSFPNAGGVLAGPHGDIYALEQGYIRGKNVSEVFRLAPGRNELTAATVPRPPVVRVPHAGQSLLLLTATSAAGLGTTSSYWLRPDGSRLLHPVRRVADLCASTGGRVVAFTSDATVPREPFVYVAPAKSGPPRKVSEQAATPVCPFDGRHLVLSTGVFVGFGTAWTLDAYDIRTRHLRRIVNGTPQYAASPGGRRLAYVQRTARGDSLVVVDLGTGRRRRLAGPIDRGVVSPNLGWYEASDDLKWSPDGRRVAFVTGRPFGDRDLGAIDWSNPKLPRHSYAVSIADVDGHPVRRIATIVGGPPTVSWSPDGTKLLVCTAARPPAPGCQGDAGALGTSSSLHLLNTIGPVRDVVVASGEIDFAGWNPAGDGLAWADAQVLHLASGRTLRLPYLAQHGGWVGWSPDGRYIATGRDDGYTVIDLVTGKKQALLSGARAENAVVRWWR